MKKTAIFLADGFEENEGLIVVDLLRRAGISIQMVSITGKLNVTGSHKICVMADCLFEECDIDSMDMLILPGGMPGTKHLLSDKKLCDTLIEHNKNEKALAAICAAPSVLGHCGILKGKRAVCYPSFEEQLDGAEVSFDEVMVDGTIITSRGLGTAIPFALEIITYLADRETSKKVKDSILFRG